MSFFLKKIFFFIPFLLFSYLGLVYITDIPLINDLTKNFKPLVKGGNGHFWTRLKEADTIQNIDVLILGSSLAYRGIDTRNFEKLGLTAFNLGSSAQTPIQTEYLIEKYIGQMNPKLIIWDVNPFTFSDSGLESYLDLVSNCEDCSGLFSLALKINRIEGYNGLVKSLFFANKDIEFLESIQNEKDTYIKGGFVERVNQKFEVQNLENPQIQFLDSQKAAFEKSISNLAEKNIPVILVFAPISRDLILKITNKDEYQKYFTEIVERCSLKSFLDFNEILNLSNKYFYDEFHLNKNGVEIYNYQIIENLKELIDNGFFEGTNNY